MIEEDRLRRAVDSLFAALDGLPQEALYREPAAGEWTVMANLAHIAEMLPYWAHQCEAIAASPGTPFGRALDDPGRVDPIRDHAGDALSVTKPALQASLDEAIASLKSIDPASWTYEGQHPSRGAMTIQQVVDTFIVGHLDAHIEQIKRALAQSPSQVP